MRDLRTGRKHAYYAFLLLLMPNASGWELKNRGAWLNGYVPRVGTVVEPAYYQHDHAAEGPDYVQVVYTIAHKQHQNAALAALSQGPMAMAMSQRFKHDRKATSAVAILPGLTLLELELQASEETINESTLLLWTNKDANIQLWCLAIGVGFENCWTQRLGVLKTLHKQTLGKPWYELGLGVRVGGLL